MRKYKLTKDRRLKRLYRGNSAYRDLAKDYDNIGFISKKLGDELSKLYDEEYVLGIHRTGNTPVTENFLYDVFNNGLINNGHVMQGTKDEYINIERTVSLFKNLVVFMGQLKASKGYKDSEGSIIVKIPKSYLGLSEGEVKPIYFDSNGQIRLIPEFIYGYVPVNDNYECGDIIRNPNYSDIHSYDNGGLIYDVNVDVSSYKK